VIEENPFSSLSYVKTYTFYQIRPYTINILNALAPFFNIIPYSRLPYNTLKKILDRLEIILNKPIMDQLLKYAESNLKHD